MTESDTDAARLEEIEKRCNEATAGPWERWDEHAIVFAGPSKCNTPGDFGGGRGQIADFESDDFGDDSEEGDQLCEANAEFSAHARQDVPWLLSKCRGLSAENERLRKVEAARCKEPDCADGYVPTMPDGEPGPCPRCSGAPVVAARCRTCGGSDVVWLHTARNP